MRVPPERLSHQGVERLAIIAAEYSTPPSLTYREYPLSKQPTDLGNPGIEPGACCPNPLEQKPFYFCQLVESNWEPSACEARAVTPSAKTF